MKQCPACNRTYDDSLAFCLMDGTPLTIESEEKTLVIQPPTRKKSRFLLWLGLIGLIFLAGCSLIVGLLIYKFGSQGDGVRGKRQTTVSTQQSPVSPSTLKTAPANTSAKSSPVEDSSPKAEESKSTPDSEDTEDITPIAWDTTAGGFKGETGQTYKFRCPEGGTEQGVYGSDVYTQDSSICTAAVHAGLITLAQGGVVTVEYRPGRSTYGSTVRNGIKSRTWGEYPRSFVVR
jgi:uncharacterized iron-regulated membrane protein